MSGKLPCPMLPGHLQVWKAPIRWVIRNLGHPVHERKPQNVQKIKTFFTFISHQNTSSFKNKNKKPLNGGYETHKHVHLVGVVYIQQIL